MKCATFNLKVCFQTESECTDVPLGALDSTFRSAITLVGLPRGFLQLSGRAALINDCFNDKLYGWFLIISDANSTVRIAEFVDAVDKKRGGHIGF